MREQNMWNRTLMDLVFPRRCPICDAVMAYGEQGICNRHKTLPYVTGPVCMKCGKELSEAEQEYCEDCRRHTRSFERAYPVFRYEEPVASSVLLNIIINGNMWIIMATFWQNVSEKQGLQTGYRSFFRCRYISAEERNVAIIRLSFWPRW